MAKFKNSDLYLKDNQKIRFGTDQDSDMYHDGTQLRVSTVVSGVDPTQDYHLTTKQYVTANPGDHGNLSGRDDDDHTQYILVDGTRGFTGTVSGVTPTEDYHLARKDYVDAVESKLDTTSGTLQTQIDGKSDTGHQHTSPDVTDFGEAAQDAVGNIMTGAGGVSVDYNDVANTITISGGGGSFTSLSDTPSNYTTSSGLYVRVKSTEDGLEFAEAGGGTFVSLTDTPASYTSQAGKVVAVNTGATALEFVAAGSANLDGGHADSVYGGTTAVDGGDATSF